MKTIFTLHFEGLLRGGNNYFEQVHILKICIIFDGLTDFFINIKEHILSLRNCHFKKSGKNKGQLWIIFYQYFRLKYLYLRFGHVIS